MNSVIDTINQRTSLRVYADRDIEKIHEDIIIKSAMRAPTAGNMMMYSIIRIKNQQLKDRLSKTCDNQPFIAKAPMLLVFVADVQKWYDYFDICKAGELAEKSGRKAKKPGLGDFMLAVNDALIAAQNAVIAAESLGIGSCYIGDMMERYEEHKKLLNLPQHAFPVTMLTLGYYPEGRKKIIRDRFDEKYVVFDEAYTHLNGNDLSDMFSAREASMPKSNPFNAENYGQLIYMRKITSDFMEEMDRSVSAGIKCFTGKSE